MKERFEGEWVLVGDPEMDEGLNVTGGEVLWHSKDRDELYRKTRKLPPLQSAILCFSSLLQRDTPGCGGCFVTRLYRNSEGS